MYQARQTYRAGQLRRRSRDNLIAAVVGGVLILGVVGGQIAFYAAGPGAPVPSPSPSSSTSATVPAPTPTITP